MSCNRILKPEFTKKQISDCGKCKHASARVAWCGLFGVHIIEHGTIITPQYPSIPKMAGSLVKSTGKHIASGFKKRTDLEVDRIMEICKACDHFNSDAVRCYKCGCNMKHKIPWQTTHCSIGKW